MTVSLSALIENKGSDKDPPELAVLLVDGLAN